MNSFKTMIALFSVLVATCSGQYATQSWGSQSSIPAPPSSGMVGYGNKVLAPAASPAQQSYVAPVAQSAASQQQFPASTQQICTCVALPAAGQQTGSSSQSAPVDNQQSVAPTQTASSSAQSYGAPAQQAASPSAQTYSAPAAAPLAFRPAARPSYAAPATKGASY